MEPTSYKTKYAMATNLGYSEITNSKQRELPWYGLWNVILTEHFPIASPFLVSPQYPLWHLDDVDVEVEPEDLSFTLKAGDPIPGGIEPADQSFSSSASLHGDKSRIPDFAIVYLSSGVADSWELGVVPRVPLIVEIKKWVRCEDRRKNRAELRRMFVEAQSDAEEQARYLFADSLQKSVLAVAACADQWKWAKLSRDNNPPPLTTGERDDPTWLPRVISSPTWSSIMEFGTQKSDEALEKLVEGTKNKSAWD
jgi:hypothetical protein